MNVSPHDFSRIRMSLPAEECKRSWMVEHTDCLLWYTAMLVETLTARHGYNRFSVAVYAHPHTHIYIHVRSSSPRGGLNHVGPKIENSHAVYRERYAWSVKYSEENASAGWRTEIDKYTTGENTTRKEEDGRHTTHTYQRGNGRDRDWHIATCTQLRPPLL